MEKQTLNDPDPTYRTSDLNIIAFLLAMGCTYIRAEKTPDDRQIVNLHFLNPPHCEKLEREFHTKNPKVPVKDFIAGLNSAKDIIFGERRRT